MTKNRSSCIALIILVGGLLGLVILGGLYYYVSYAAPNALAESRILSGPPTILVRSPREGESVAAGTPLLARATVTAQTPITRVELWLDGKLAATESPPAPGQTTFFAVFELGIDPGNHLLHWRAVDDQGLVGQTAPVSIASQSAAGAADVSTVVAGEGQSLEDIATARGTDPGVLQDLNPNLGGGGLSPGTVVNVPSPNAAAAEPNTLGDQSTPPLPQTSAGTTALLPVDPSAFNLSSYLPGLLAVAKLSNAPSNLEAGVEDCRIRLVWNDNASDESGFRIWMQPLGGLPVNTYTTAPNPGTGETMFEFDAPAFGIYSFWVEAFNPLGAQPSAIVSFPIHDASCKPALAGYLRLEGLGMRVTGPWSDIYCYLSLEKAPEKRIPDGGGFLEMGAMGSLDIRKSIGGENSLLLKTPADGEVALAGDCWAWLGDAPSSIGAFTASVPSDQWDDRPLQITKPNYVIDIRIGPASAGDFSYLDYNFPAPESVRVPGGKAGEPPVPWGRLSMHTLYWSWYGNTADLTGFTVYVDGAPVEFFPYPWGTVYGGSGPASFSRTIPLPTECGATYKIEMRAQSGPVYSTLSEAYDFEQPPCQAYAEVELYAFNFDYIHMGPVCGDVDVLARVIVNDAEFRFRGPVQCSRSYGFSDLPRQPVGGGGFWNPRTSAAGPDTVTVPVDISDPSLEIIITFEDENPGALELAQPICMYIDDVALFPMSPDEWDRWSKAYRAVQCAYFPDPRFSYWEPDEFAGSGTIWYAINGVTTAPADE